MANITGAITELRRARGRAGPVEGVRNIDRYKPEYVDILEGMAELAGDDAFEEVTRWMIEFTEERERLPTPPEVRERSRKVCRDRGVEVPGESPLWG